MISFNKFESDARDVGPCLEGPASQLLALFGQDRNIGSQYTTRPNVKGKSRTIQPFPVTIRQVVGDVVVGAYWYRIFNQRQLILARVVAFLTANMDVISTGYFRAVDELGPGRNDAAGDDRVSIRIEQA